MASSTTERSGNVNGGGDDDDLPPPQGERHILKSETELRLEVSPGSSSSSNNTNPLLLTLQKGSCELWGVELALHKTYSIYGGCKVALFTWHGCVIDVHCAEEGRLEISYVSEECHANVAFVNTHAQLEALRDDALANKQDGPRVLICGPPESGKTSLARILTAYATKLGRTPLLVDLNPSDNSLSVPGTLAVAPMTASAVSVETFATTGLEVGTATPLTMWYGHLSLQESNTELFSAQVQALALKMDKRMENDTDAARASGIIVNTNGWIQDDGYKMLLKTIEAMRITVILIMGHDRLYSMLKSHFDSKEPQQSSSSSSSAAAAPKIIKLPRSGGVVSRDTTFMRAARSQSIRRYFYGQPVEQGPNHHRVPTLTPFLAHVEFKDVILYKLSSVALSASLLPVSAKQSTEPVQLTPVKITEQPQHALLAVCHPTAVQAYEDSGRARDLYEAGVAGFVVVERVVMDMEMLHLLCPCAGALPSHTLLCGDVTWME